MHRQFLTILFFFAFGFSFAQEYCDTLPAAIKSKYDRYTSRQFDRLQKKRDPDKYEAYDIAEYLRHKKDSACKQWYSLFISGLQKMLQGPSTCFKGDCFLFKAAKSYYYLGDLRQADQYLVKAYAYGENVTCLDYYCNLIGGPKCK